jgi:parvulin-like peptidyl-prolyl isomerase
VLRSDFDKHLKALETDGATIDPAARPALLDSFLEEQVLVLEARNRGLITPQTPAPEAQSAVQKMLADDVLSKVAVLDDEVAAYFQSHKRDFHAEERVTLRQILVSTEGEAREIERHLQKDPMLFDSIARSQSKSPEGPDGGLMGTFSKGELPPALEQAAFSMASGATQIIQTPMGFHVLRVDARQAARERPFEECRGEIREVLARQKSDESVHELVRELLARAKVNHEAALEPQRPS